MTCKMTVLGAVRAVADGTPFLAHSTGCKTIWTELVRTDAGLAFATIEGPRPERDEPFPAYRERFYQFYADCVERAFAGDPRNISLSPNWAKTFQAMFKGREDTYRRPTRVHRRERHGS
jgi:hypothetical protein